ncbi:hypothetical protein [uncultured Cohaesibacter sp.]|uniref:hypothetical protein n=1 Tax=uncultured Cohaesibacter sp. TaxID=1002546 RepID=UPI0029C602A6|nr:hypothetical protein [uncultured Cohaesibacter sp.]
MSDVSDMDCQRKVANDPRPLTHHLDDFNTGRTPLGCETVRTPPVYKPGRIIIR